MKDRNIASVDQSDELDEQFAEEDAEDWEGGSFRCPACGSEQENGAKYISTAPIASDPWSLISEVCICAGCKREIPAHLARRWNGLSYEDAKREWKETFEDRDDSLSSCGKNRFLFPRE